MGVKSKIHQKHQTDLSLLASTVLAVATNAELRTMFSLHICALITTGTVLFSVAFNYYPYQ